MMNSHEAAKLNEVQKQNWIAVRLRTLRKYYTLVTSREFREVFGETYEELLYNYTTDPEIAKKLESQDGMFRDLAHARR